MSSRHYVYSLHTKTSVIPKVIILNIGLCYNDSYLNLLNLTKTERSRRSFLKIYKLFSCINKQRLLVAFVFYNYL